MLLPVLLASSSVTSSLGRGTQFLHLWHTATSACTGHLSKDTEQFEPQGALTVGLVTSLAIPLPKEFT